MNWWQAIILGLVQGLTEFLPVSSSGHLVLTQNLLGVTEESAMFFFIMLHLATAAAVCLALFKPIKALFKWPIPNKVWFLAAATIPAMLVGLILDDIIEGFFDGKFLWIFFLVTAALLLTTEFIAKHNAKKLETASENTSGSQGVSLQAIPSKAITLRHAIVMGFAQAVAVLPGISRSGSTICAGVLQGADRKEVADFSFLMSLPIILGSALLEIISAAKTGFGGIDILNLLLGMATAFLSGLVAIKFMLKVIAKANYKWFSLYLLIIGIVSLVLTLNGFFG